jgi:DNA-binding NarL/FixJ family response regulator
MKKILLVDDHEPFRKCLRGFLQTSFPDVEFAEAGSGPEAFRQIAKPAHPDVVIMDIGLPGENGLSLTRRIKERYPQICVLILTNQDLPEYRQAAARCQADGFFLKDSAGEELVAAIEACV